MAIAKIWDGADWVPTIVGAKGDKGDPGDPGIDIDEGSGFQDGDVLIYDTATDTWIPGTAAAGAVGGGDDKVFWENDQSVTTNYEVSTGQNAGTFGPITIDDGVTVTVPSGSVWVVV